MARAGGFALAARAGRVLGRWTRGFMSRKRSGSAPTRSKSKRRRTSRSNKGVSKGQVTIDGSGGSHSIYRHAHVWRTPRIGPLQKLLTKDVLSYNTTRRITAGASFQSADEMVTFLNTPDLRLMANTFDSGSAAYTVKFIVHSAYLETKYTNMDKANVQMTIYDIVPKRDIPNGSANDFPIASWSTGLTAMNNLGSTTPAPTNLGATPFDSPRFCQLHTIKKVTKVTLAQGQCHTHRIRIKVNRVFNKALMGYIERIARVTHQVVTVCNGLPLNDQTTKTNIATGAVVVDSVSMVRYVYQGIATNSSNYSFSDNQTAPATAYLLDPGSGEPEADAAA